MSVGARETRHRPSHAVDAGWARDTTRRDPSIPSGLASITIEELIQPSIAYRTWRGKIGSQSARPSDRSSLRPRPGSMEPAPWPKTVSRPGITVPGSRGLRSASCSCWLWGFWLPMCSGPGAVLPMMRRRRRRLATWTMRRAGRTPGGTRSAAKPRSSSRPPVGVLCARPQPCRSASCRSRMNWKPATTEYYRPQERLPAAAIMMKAGHLTRLEADSQGYAEQKDRDVEGNVPAPVPERLADNRPYTEDHPKAGASGRPSR